METKKTIETFLEKIMPSPTNMDAEYSELRAYGKVKTFREIHEEHKRAGGIIKLGNYGIPGLDAATGGIYEGEVIAISGLTKHGKTTMAQSITYGLCKKENPVGWFTFEVPPAQFLQTFENYDNPMDYGILPVEHKAGDLKWLFERIAEMHVTWSARIFFIDHLHYLFDMWSTRNVALTIGQVIRALKHLAITGGFAIFLLCHYSKGQREENEDTYENIRDSSLIAQESDSVLLIRRVKDGNKYTNNAILSVEFHRRTGVMKKKIGLVKIGNFLYERVLEEEGARDKKQGYL
jgi:archaellum biogenesis ATPase FlaH